MISKEDVLKVAQGLHMSPTEEQIQEVIDGFDDEAENDPTGDWILWIENLLHNADVKQVIPPKKIQHFLFDMTTGEVQLDLGEITELEAEKFEDGSLRVITQHQLLVEESILSIRKDVADEDFTVIEGLLQTLSLQKLKDFLAKD